MLQADSVQTFVLFKGGTKLPPVYLHDHIARIIKRLHVGKSACSPLAKILQPLLAKDIILFFLLKKKTNPGNQVGFFVCDK
jgi:hypothetical protein